MNRREAIANARLTRWPAFADRLLSRIDFRGDCWTWKGQISTQGYGVIRRDGHTLQVHRAVWEHLVGPIPPGLVLDHVCRTRPCCNPDHLEPVAERVNVAERAHSAAGRNLRKTHCPRGHEYTPENTGKAPGPHGPRRRCLICHRERERERQRQRREAA